MVEAALRLRRSGRQPTAPQPPLLCIAQNQKSGPNKLAGGGVDELPVRITGGGVGIVELSLKPNRNAVGKCGPLGPQLWVRRD